MDQLESDLEQKCRKLAEKYKCKLLKIQKVKGFPDRLLVCPGGKCMFMEFKRPKVGAIAEPLQEHILLQLREMEHKAEVVACKEDFLEYLKRMLN